MEPIKITINGLEINTTSGKTILEVVEENKLDTIPTLCHDKELSILPLLFMCS